MIYILSLFNKNGWIAGGWMAKLQNYILGWIVKGWIVNTVGWIE